MLVRAALVWFVIMLAAILNGAVRDTIAAPRLGDAAARALSCVTLTSAIVLVTWLTIRWIDPSSSRDAWRIGTMWLMMTLAFEFGAGHYVFHTPWAALLADYNVLAGRLWILVLCATLTAPVIVYRAGHYHVRTTEISAAISDAAPRR